MKDIALVIMAAGMGSRYGGLKQIDPIDDQGHIIMDFSIFDAKKAGFEKVPVLLFNYANKYYKSTKTNLKLAAQRYNDTDLISRARNVVIDEAIPLNLSTFLICSN